MSKQTDREKELDEFWDIESLVPTSSKPRVAPSRSQRENRHISAVPIELNPPNPRQGASPVQDAPLTVTVSPRVAPNESRAVGETLVYQPKHPLIREVRVLPWRSDFRFYERFCTMARELFARRGHPAE